MAVTPHMHVGFIEFIFFVFYLLLAGFLLRVLEITCANNQVGKALSFIY